jgi:molybdopterin-biosynthesis enzyme MoeA-like protein
MGGAINESALKMAEVPEGARLLDSGAFPVVALNNVFILPGVPEIFADKLDRVCQQFSGEPPIVQRMYLRTPETAVAAELARAQRDHPEVKIGSYPLTDRDDYNLMVTVEGTHAHCVGQAIARLVELLPSRVIHRVGAGKPGDF